MRPAPPSKKRAPMTDNPVDSAHRGAETLLEIACDPARVAELYGCVGEFCHLLRNRLNGLQIGLYLARRSDATGANAAVWDDLEAHYREAERVLELFQNICRPISLTTISVGLNLVLDEFTSRWAPRFAARGARLSSTIAEADGPSHLDPTRLAQGLDALASWRIHRAEPGRQTSIRGWVGQGRSRVEWTENVSSPCDHNGELPLAALARVLSAHGGSMSRDVRGGWGLRLDWPHAGASPVGVT